MNSLNTAEGVSLLEDPFFSEQKRVRLKSSRITQGPFQVALTADSSTKKLDFKLESTGP